MIDYNYDERFGVLYISVADAKNSYGESSEDGRIVILRNLDTEEIVGVTIFIKDSSGET